MITFKVALSNFFDRKVVVDAMDERSRKAMSKVGAFVRTRARSSMRRTKSLWPWFPGWPDTGGSRHTPPSPAGRPPRSRSGQLKDLLFFSYDASTRSVVVGPVGFRKGEAPGLNEFGGIVTRTRRGRQGGRVICKYPARPFMAPALVEATENGRLVRAWEVLGSGAVVSRSTV